MPNQRWRTQSALLFSHSWKENKRIHTFPKDIRALWNAIKLVQDLNSCHHVHFLHMFTIPVNTFLHPAMGDLKMLTVSWSTCYNIISNDLHMFTIPVNTFLQSPTGLLHVFLVKCVIQMERNPRDNTTETFNNLTQIYCDQVLSIHRILGGTRHCWIDAKLYIWSTDLLHTLKKIWQKWKLSSTWINIWRCELFMKN